VPLGWSSTFFGSRGDKGTAISLLTANLATIVGTYASGEAVGDRNKKIGEIIAVVWYMRTLTRPARRFGSSSATAWSRRHGD
jgi:hypothetical protein